MKKQHLLTLTDLLLAPLAEPRKVYTSLLTEPIFTIANAMCAACGFCLGRTPRAARIKFLSVTPKNRWRNSESEPTVQGGLT